METSSEHLNHPLLKSVPVRTSFKDTSKMVQGDVLAQNVFISLDKAIKFEKSVKKTPEGKKYLDLFVKLHFIKHITVLIYFLFMFFEIPTW
jgi:hypothetical protein